MKTWNTYTLLYNADQVAEVEKQVAAIQGDKPTQASDTPIAKE